MSVLFSPSDTVVTPFGHGQVIASPRSSDGMVEVELSWGEVSKCRAFLRPSDVVIKKKLFDMTDEDKLDKAATHRKEGNVMFKLEAFEHAIKKYELARIYLRQLNRVLTSKETEETLVPLLNNVALSHLMLNHPPEVIDTCNEALRSGASELALSKTLYLRAQAFCKTQDYESALHDLKRALIVQPNNKAIRELLEKVVTEIRRGKEKARQMYGGAFADNHASIPPSPSPTPPPPTPTPLQPTSTLNVQPKQQQPSQTKDDDISPLSALAVLAVVGAISAFLAYTFTKGKSSSNDVTLR